MIGQKNMGVKHFFPREIEVQVQENLNLDHVCIAAKGLCSRITYGPPAETVVTAVTTVQNLLPKPNRRGARLRFIIANMLGHNAVPRLIGVLTDSDLSEH